MSKLKQRKHNKLIQLILNKVFAYEYIGKDHFKNEIQDQKRRVERYVEEKYPGTNLHITTEFIINSNNTFKIIKSQRWSKASKKYPERLKMKDTLCPKFWDKEIYMKDYVRDYYQDHIERIEKLMQRKNNAN